MGSLYVSASEIEVFDLCPRKWAFGYIEGKRAPPNDAAALGTRVHSILQFWLRDGAPPDTWTAEGEIAASGLHLLPPPRYPGLVTEEEFRFTSQRAWYIGYKDFRYRDANGLIHVGDHKTTKSSTWIKSVEDILAHPQSLIYAVDEFFKNPNDDRIALDWIYYKTQGARKAEPRFQIVTKDVVAEMFFEHVDPVAGEITRLHHETQPGASALDFPPDFRACDAFGGCAFLSICNPTPTQRMEATMTQAGMSLAEKLKAMKNGKAQSPIHPPEAHQGQPPPGAPVAYQGAPVPTGAPQFSVPTPQTPYVPPTPQAAPQAPPQAAYQPPTPQAAPQPAYQPPVPQGAPQAAYAPPVDPGPLAPESPPAEAAPKKPRGRPKKATSAVATDGFTLYVGCTPIGCEVTSALDYVNAAHDLLKESGVGISHYRQMEFGKGPAALCATLENLLALCDTEGNAPSGDVVLGSTQIEEDTASVWFTKASKVVRAFR